MRKLLTTITAFALTLSCLAPFGGALADSTATVKIPDIRANGRLVTFPDAQPYVDENSRTMMPLRFVSEKLGATVNWDSKTNGAVLTKNGLEVDVPIGSDTLTVKKADGTSSTVKMDTEAVLKADRTYVPIRFVANALGAWVGYSDLYNTVLVNQMDMTPAEIDKFQSYYDMNYRESAKAFGSYDEFIAKGYDLTPNARLQKNYSGTNGFSNAVESLYRDAHIGCNDELEGFQNWSGNNNGRYIGLDNFNTYEDYAIGYREEAAHALQHALCWDKNGWSKSGCGDKATVTLKSDPALVFHSKCDNDLRVRGVVTVTPHADCDMDSLKTYATKLGIDASKLQAGQSYSFNGEIYLDFFNNTLECYRCDNLDTRAVNTSDANYVG